MLKSSLALRRKLEKFGKLNEFHEQIQLELERDYMKIIREDEEIELAAFPECFNRLNVTYKKDSRTTPARVVNDHSTLHHPGQSCNIAQVKGKTSLNLCHNVLFHFFLHCVPLVMDLAKCYRSVRCKTLTNSIRRVIWFTDPTDERTATSMMMLRMAYGDKIADKVILSLIHISEPTRPY